LCCWQAVELSIDRFSPKFDTYCSAYPPTHPSYRISARKPLGKDVLVGITR